MHICKYIHICMKVMTRLYQASIALDVMMCYLNRGNEARLLHFARHINAKHIKHT